MVVSSTQCLAVVAMFGGIIVGRFVAETGLRALTTEQKGALVDAFADIRRYQLVVIAAMVLLALSYPYLSLVGIVAYLLVVGVVVHRRLGCSGLPRAYVRRQLAGTWIGSIGIVAGMATWLWP